MTHIDTMRQARDALQQIATTAGRYDTPGAPNHMAMLAQKHADALSLAIDQAERNAPLDRMADNARETGLDYEPPQAERQEPVAHLWQHSETGRTRIVMPDQIITADANWFVVGPLYLAPPQRQPEQEPVAWMAVSPGGNVRFTDNAKAAIELGEYKWTLTPLYAVPPQQQREPVAAGWSVFNTGAEVWSGLSLTDAVAELTPQRLARGWSAVCVINKDNPPIYTAPPRRQPLDVLAVTTAYEQGVGKGIQAAQRGAEIDNPYAPGDCREAWALGYEEGKSKTPRQPLTPTVPADANINQRISFKAGWRAAEAAHGIGGQV